MIGVQLTHKIGFIGYKNHAKKLLDIVEGNVDFEVSQIYHPTKNIDDSRITNNLKDLYECDGVFIASPNNTHYEYLKEIIENSNCLIYCEKPPVTSSEGIEYLEKLTSEQKKRIFFGFNLRFSKFNDLLKEYSKSEKLGKIIQINIITSQGLAFKEKYLTDWRADGENNLHNMIENNSVHWIDLMVFNFGKTTNSNYMPRLISNNGTSFDTSSVNLQFENGIVASIFTSYATPLIENIVIVGTNGFVIIKDGKMEIFYPRDTFDENGLFTNPKTKEEVDFSFQINGKNSLKKSVGYFLECLKSSKSFENTYFDTSMYTNKLILDLEKMDK